MKNIVFLFFALITFLSCDREKDVWRQTYEVINNSTMDREFETVEIDISDIPLDDFSITDLKTKERFIYQLVDEDLDGKNDVLLFQPKVKANSSQKYYLTFASEEKDSFPLRCYSRFVPERTDDYAWENNKVAFRTFGPVAQQMKEQGIKGGTLTSGIDAWLKRVEYPIINKWYKRNEEKQGAYHKDTGEGLDNFHVGSSRGIGGISVKVDTNHCSSKNFSSYKTITTGPIRTSFILNYKSWNAAGKMITETKRISLDYGHCLSRFEVAIKGTNQVAVGLTLHKNEGITKVDGTNCAMSYWEPLDDSELGTGFVTTKKYFIDIEKYISAQKDKSHLYANLNVADQKVVYYAGFGWKKAKQFNTHQEWQAYLVRFAKQIENPLVITLTR